MASNGTFTYEYDLLWSFVFEGFLLVLMMMLLVFYFKIQSNLAWLQKKENIKKIDELLAY